MVIVVAIVIADGMMVGFATIVLVVDVGPGVAFFVVIGGGGNVSVTG